MKLRHLIAASLLSGSFLCTPRVYAQAVPKTQIADGKGAAAGVSAQAGKTGLNVYVLNPAGSGGGSVDVSTLAKEVTLDAILDRLNSTIGVSGPLTDAQLRALPVPVMGSVTAAVTGAVEVTNQPAPVPFVFDPSGYLMVAPQGTQAVSGTVAVSNFPATVEVSNFPSTTPGLTDAELRSAPVPVSGSVTVANPVTSVTVSNLPATQAVSGSVSVSNFPSTQPISGSVSVSNFPSSQQITGTLTGITNPIYVEPHDHVSVVNSTTTPLAANATFTGTAASTLHHSTVMLHVVSDRASASGGVKIQFSSDGVNWDEEWTSTFTAGTGAAVHHEPVRGSFWRVVYVNGSQAQTYFRLQAMLKSSVPGPSIHDIRDPITDLDHAAITKSLIAGKTTAGGGSYVEVKVNPSGALAADVTGSTVTATTPTTPTATISGCVNVTAVSSMAVAANTSRGSLTLMAPTTNDQKLYVKLGATATITNIPLLPGQSLSLDSPAKVYTGQIDAISALGTQTLCVIEF